MEIDIFNYIEKKQYEKICNELKNSEIRTIYSNNHIDIEIKKVGGKIFTYINTYGDKKINQALNNICSLV